MQAFFCLGFDPAILAHSVICKETAHLSIRRAWGFAMLAGAAQRSAVVCLLADTAHIIVKYLVKKTVVQPALQTVQVGLVLGIELVGRGPHPKLPDNAFALDKGVLPRPLHRRLGQARGCYRIAEKGVLAIAELVLHRTQVLL